MNQIQAVVKEAEMHAEFHPSKDIRFFAQSVIDAISQLESIIEDMQYQINENTY